jgi:hypothetical protein
MTFEDRYEDFDTTPIRCVECGGYASPDEGEFVYTPGGPVCGNCAHPERIEAA